MRPSAQRISAAIVLLSLLSADVLVETGAAQSTSTTSPFGAQPLTASASSSVSATGPDTANDDAWARAVLQPPPCTIPIYTGALSLRTYRHHFKGRAPFVLNRLASTSAELRAKSTLEALQADLADTPVLLASSNSFSHDKRPSTLGQYLSDHLVRQSPSSLANETWYLFGDTPLPSLTRLYTMPLDAAEDEGLVAFGVGGQFSGVSFHTHGAAWAEVLHGGKRWWLAPPGQRPHFHGDRHQLQWLLQELPAYQPGIDALAQSAGGYLSLRDSVGLSSSGGGKDEAGAVEERRLAAHLHTNITSAPMLTCELGPGQVLYIPGGWWHATLNTGPYNAFVSTFTREK